MQVAGAFSNARVRRHGRAYVLGLTVDDTGFLTHYAISALTFTAAAAGSPTRLSPDQPGSALEQVMADITASRSVNQRRERTYRN